MIVSCRVSPEQHWRLYRILIYELVANLFHKSPVHTQVQHDQAHAFAIGTNRSAGLTDGLISVTVGQPVSVSRVPGGGDRPIPGAYVDCCRD